MRNIFKILLLALVIALSTGANSVFAQTKKLTKEELVERSNALYEGGKRRESLDLIAEYPEFADEIEVLYVKSVALVELRDYENADVVFQRQFDIFLKNADEALKMAREFLMKDAASKEDKEFGAFMYATAMLSFSSADLVNSLRTVAMEKNGLPRARLEPKNLNGFAGFRKLHVETAVKAGELNLELNQLTDALGNFNRAVELDAKNAAAYAGRAKLYRKQRKLALARADERRAKMFAQ